MELLLPSISATWLLQCDKYGNELKSDNSVVTSSIAFVPSVLFIQGIFPFLSLVTILAESRNDPSSPHIKQGRLTGDLSVTLICSSL